MDFVVLAPVVVSNLAGGLRTIIRNHHELYEVVEVLSHAANLPRVGTRGTYAALCRQFPAMRSRSISLGDIGIHYDTGQPVSLKK